MIYLLLFVVAVVVSFGEHWLGMGHGLWQSPSLHVLRVEQGVHLGHLVLTLPHHPMAQSIAQSWSRLLDMLLWLLAAPLAIIIGWHQALVCAGVALGPLSLGALVVALFWAVEPFIFQRLGWLILVAILVFATVPPPAPVMLEGEVWPLMALLALMSGGVLRALRGSVGFAFIAGLAGGFAIWLTPLALPFVALAYGGVVVRWFYAPNATCLLAMAAGIFDVLCLGFFVDPPMGGYGVAVFTRLSYVYVALGSVLLASAACLPRLQKHLKTGRGLVGALVIILPLCAWALIFPGIMRGILLPTSQAYGWSLAYGALGVVYALFFIHKTSQSHSVMEDPFLELPGTSPATGYYLLFCTLVTTALSVYYSLFGIVTSLLCAGLVFVVVSKMYAAGLRRVNAGGTRK